MTKSDLINHLGRVRRIPESRAESIVNAIFNSIEATLQRGERIEIRGFGSFEVRSYRAYAGRNPRSGSKVAVAAKQLPFFKVGKEMRDRINLRPLGARGTAAAHVVATAAERQPTPAGTPGPMLVESPAGIS